VTLVVGTAGHIDHGKTALLKALTGMDADRLPEEQRRGMTIDLGYAYMTLPGGPDETAGRELDFVDVPGHDRLVGNMLVGAGEIDAALLVVAADEGAQAQTIEHLGLLDALGVDDGVAVLTKLDLLEPTDPRRSTRPIELRALLAPTSLAGIPLVAVSSVSGEGLDALRAELAALAERAANSRHGGPRLAIDRVFAVRGRGAVVTGSLRGGPVAVGQTLRLEPSGRPVRVRDAQVHCVAVETTPVAGRVALNLAGVTRADLARGMALVGGPDVRATRRLLVAVRPSRDGRPLRDGAEVRVHLGTAETIARLRLGHDVGGPAHSAAGELLGALSTTDALPAALDDRIVLRWPSPAETAGGGRVLDAAPPARLVRRRLEAPRIARIADAAGPAARFGALVQAHGALSADDAAAIAAVLGADPAVLASTSSVVRLGDRWADPLVLGAAARAAVDAVAAAQSVDPSAPGVATSVARSAAAAAMRRAAPGASFRAEDAVALVNALVERGELERDGDVVRTPGLRPTRPAATEAAMARLEALLLGPTPPSLSDAARSVGCPPEGIRALESEARIVRLEPDLAYAAPTFEAMAARAVALAQQGPLSPATFRDATGTSRKYALAILEELDGRGVLRRTADGHVLGPRSASS
jgi:selenocysteine-specific elongation factor